jgi:hypothetical protein
MNSELDPPIDSVSPVDVAKQAKVWTWYVRGHFCLTLLWAMMMLKVIPTPVGRLLDGILEFSMYEVFVGPILSIVLISRAARFRGKFIWLAIAESSLSASGFWIILPAVQ